VARPRAADNFTVIRVRLEELRRERAGVPEHEARQPDGAQPYAVSTQSGLTAKSGLVPELRRMLSRGRRA
jgi:hypothetical protein